MDQVLSYNDDEHIESRLMKSQCLELAYQEALQNTELIVKDEASRRLRLQILLLENEADELHLQLATGDDRIDGLVEENEDLRARLDQAQEDVKKVENDLRLQTRELNNIKAELESMSGLTMDSTKVLTEKLALSRELSILKPELEHLRSQVAHQQSILAEKLALQRQVSTLEVELETERRALSRATEKNNDHSRETELQQKIEALQKDLSEEKREREMAKKEMSKEASTAQKEFAQEKREIEKSHKLSEKETEALRKELELLKRNSENAQKAAEKEIEALRNEIELLKSSSDKEQKSGDKEIEVLRKEFASTKRDIEKAHKNTQKELAASQAQVETLEGEIEQLRDNEKGQEGGEEEIEVLRKEFAHTKRDIEKAHKETQKELAASQVLIGSLESKVEQLRTKMRAAREQLKECQAELNEARNAALKLPATTSRENVPAKDSRKRSAREMSMDITIGTPDGIAGRGKRAGANRGRVDQTILGEKSTFSITPYLNKTINMAPDTQEDGQSPEDKAKKVMEQEKPTEGDQILEEEEETPELPAQQVKPKLKARKRLADNSGDEKNVLAEAKTSTKNKKSVTQKLKESRTLGKVTEEKDGDEDEQPKKPTARKIKARPMLEKVAEEEDVDENEQPEEPEDFEERETKKPVKAKIKAIEEPELKKKKRKVLGGGSKTLFDDEDGEAPKKPAKIALGPARLLGKGGLAGPRGGLKGGLAAAGGFGAFSPLKKDRRGAGASFLA
ncbi:hypothetical protein BCON_0138g00130 [Botryotinia convoluta]|uniref:Uncharacterized protein n=1 Tax=Botryotinia convoluta TaxID=54673 RepID=A0A4Z1HU46_9HELO|nr:hypothetical protein BCON_0138g00130 [Botryotinia convoluta]